MYRVECDGNTLHDIRDESYMLLSPKLSLELNKTGNFDFGILPSHPEIGNIKKLKSKVEVYDDGELLYTGRPVTDESDFYNFGQATCEGELAFLLDSVQRPKTSLDRVSRFEPISTNIEVFRSIIAEHNSQVEDAKKFTVGIIDIDSAELQNFDANYEKTWDLINSRFIGNYDGYLRVRHENGVRYIDYVKQYGKVSSQEIQFGENLLDLKRYIKAEDIVTAIIPIGGNNVTIKTANGHDGTDYIYDPAAVELYGWIYEKVEFPEAKDPDTLLSKAKEYLKTRVNLAITIELTAVDLHMIDVDINAIRLGDLVPCISKEHGLLSTPGDVSTYYLVSKYEVNLDNPANNKITLGRTMTTLTAQVAGTNNIYTIASNASSTANQASGSVEQIRKEMDELLDKFYPVGSIYETKNGSFNPSAQWGGTWKRIKGRVLVGVDENDTDFATAGKNGGSKTQALSVAQLPSHAHTQQGYFNTGVESADHTHSAQTTSDGSHTHTVRAKYVKDAASGTAKNRLAASGTTATSDNICSTVTYGGHSHTISVGGRTATHYHGVTISGSTTSIGSGEAHNNLQPYETCYIWERTA